jgi:ParB family chromosome partitioning protein
MSCPIERIHPRADQPRQRIDEEALQGLAESIKERGIIQPPLVRRRDNGDGYEIVAGERRWRAAQLAGLKEIPIVIREVDSAEAYELALVENVQRQDLNPIEEAEALQHLIDNHGYSQSELATRIGRDRSTIANALRLLGLPPEVRHMVIEGQLSEGHARALLQAPAPAKMVFLAREAVAKKWSVRETERAARAAASPAKAPAAAKDHAPEVKALVEKLQRTFGAKVNIVDRKGKGRIEIAYTSYDELDGILNRFLI